MTRPSQFERGGKWKIKSGLLKRNVAAQTYGDLSPVSMYCSSLLPLEIDDVFAQVDGYSILRQDRNRHGGGVAPYIDNSYKASLLCSSPMQVKGKPGIPEYLMCRVQRDKLPPVFVAVVYSPPDVSFSCFKDSDLFTNLTKHSKGYEYRIVMGDLNANILSTSQETNFIRDFVCEHNSKLVEHNATNHVRDSHTWIDVIYTDDDNI